MAKMELEDLGFDDWFQEKLKDYSDHDLNIARITAVDKDSYLVRNEEVEVTAELSGRLRFRIESADELPTVGDWVLLNYFNLNTFAVIEHILPRKTVLKRKVAGRQIDYQILSANVDYAFIIQSCNNDFNLRRLERYLVAVNDGNIEPIILLSKSDLVEQTDLEKMLFDIKEAKVDSKVFAYSIQSGSGLDEISRLLVPGKTFCLLGSSGVGKTTLINHFMGGNGLGTGEVRSKNSKGRHTTARRQLVMLNSKAMLIDTPGLREFGNIDVDSGIADVFPDIEELGVTCRFTDCSHTGEPGCSVIEALENNRLSPERYNSYLKLRKESAYYRMSYVEKRHKDKKLAKFIKSAKKAMKNE